MNKIKLYSLNIEIENIALKYKLGLITTIEMEQKSKDLADSILEYIKDIERNN